MPHGYRGCFHIYCQECVLPSRSVCLVCNKEESSGKMDSEVMNVETKTFVSEIIQNFYDLP